MLPVDVFHKLVASSAWPECISWRILTSGDARNSVSVCEDFACVRSGRSDADLSFSATAHEE